MREQFESQQDAFGDFMDKWAKAQDAGIFADAPKPASPTPQTADHSFFGLQNTHPTESPKEIDAKYWDAIYRASLSEPVKDESQAEEPVYMAGEYYDDHMLAEAPQDKTGFTPVKMNNGVKPTKKQYPPNPIALDSGGMDQAYSPQALGQTFDEEDFKALESMKHKLFELENKLAGAYGKGESLVKFDSQIKALQKKIDDLSTEMGHSFPTDVA